MLGRLWMAAVLLLVPVVASAFTTYPVSYSGAVSESGTPITGTRNVTLRVYGVVSGGTALHEQTESLSIVGGIFHTSLVTDAGLWTGADRWIGVSINADPELAPRIKVGWVPYAIHTPRPSPQLFTTYPTARTVTSDQWTKADSLTVTVSDPGHVVVSLLGFVQWTGAISSPPIALDLSTSTPTDFAIGYDPPDGFMNPLSMNTIVPVTPGETKIYLWTRIVTTGQSYLVETKRFQGLFIPN